MEITNTSSWRAEFPLENKYPTLNENISVDVAVVGGGIAGCISAYRLAKAGKKVALVEKEVIASGETSFTTAFLTQVIDAYLHELTKRFSEHKAGMVWRANMAAIDEVERISKVENIDCEFMRCSAYVFAADADGLKKLQQEETIAKKLDFTVAMGNEKLGFTHQGYLQVQRQGKFEPLKFIAGVTEKAQAAGALIFEKTEVVGYDGHSPVQIKTKNGATITAKDVIITTHQPNEIVPEIQTRITPYQTYALEARIPSGVIAENLYWDTIHPYHYFRVDKKEGYDRLILGGEDHITGKSVKGVDHHAELEKYIQATFPGLKYEVTHRWSGQVLETVDCLPFIGRLTQNSHHLIATGFSGSGMTFSVVSAIVNTDLILGQETVWEHLYSTRRFKAAGNIVKLGVRYMKEMIGSRVEAKKHSTDEIAPDSGMVVKENGQDVAVYKDASGKTTKLSAKCTHLDCLVDWNDSEKTWDCPCHGSRFAKDGAVINGPAKNPLPKIE